MKDLVRKNVTKLLVSFGVAQIAFNSICQAQTTMYVGNYGSAVGLVNVGSSAGADGIAPLVILGEYNSSGPLASSAVTLPTGAVQDVDFYGGPSPWSFYNFTLYALSPAVPGPNANEQAFTVIDSEAFSGSVSAAGVITLPVSSGFFVNSGDLLAFAGVGPYYANGPNDALNSDATYWSYSSDLAYLSNPGSVGAFSTPPPGGVGTQFTVGLFADPNASYDYIPDDDTYNQGRTYAIGVDVSEVPEPTTVTLVGALLLLLFGVHALRVLCNSGSAS